jgi:ribosomal protection tetracycline resistance protein
MARLRLEIPMAAMGAVLPVLARLGATATRPLVRGDLSIVDAVLPLAQVYGLQQQLPRLTGGEGVLESSPGGYQPVRGNVPSRPRTGDDPT